MSKAYLIQAGIHQAAADAIGEKVANSLTAVVGPAQNTAAICPADVNVFTTVAANGACIIGAPSVGSLYTLSAPGDEITVINYGANPLSIYPPVGGKISNGTANAAVSVAANAGARFKCIDGINFHQF